MQIDLKALYNTIVEYLEEELTSQGVMPLSAIRISEETANYLITQLEDETSPEDTDEGY